MALISHFSKNLQKSHSGWVLRRQTPIASGGWWLHFQAPSVTRLSSTNLLTTSPKFDMLLKLFNLRFWSFPFSKSWLLGKSDPQLLIFHSLLHKSLSFRKFLMMSFHVMYGLALPPIQNPGYAYALKHEQYAYQIPVVTS